MEIFYNELSHNPLATDYEKAKERIISLLKTMKSLRDYDLNIMRTYDGFYAEKLADEYSFSSFLGDSSVSRDLKTLLRTIVANPFIEDADSNEAESYISHAFTTQNHLDETVSPEGLASAYLFNSPAISIGSHEFWKNNVLSLTITSDETSAKREENVLNLFSTDCVKSAAFGQWIDELNPPIQLNSEENIYKIFPNPLYIFEKRAINDIFSWFSDDKKCLGKVKELLYDIPCNHHASGKGKTEILKAAKGRISKRITEKDRLVYTYSEGKITIHQCRGHYDDK